jgi:hypothetical protein
MATGLYLNHFDYPSLKVVNPLHFVASRFIRIGEEVTANYTTYSQHAAKHIRESVAAAKLQQPADASLTIWWRQFGKNSRPGARSVQDRNRSWVAAAEDVFWDDHEYERN